MCILFSINMQTIWSHWGHTRKISQIPIVRWHFILACKKLNPPFNNTGKQMCNVSSYFWNEAVYSNLEWFALSVFKLPALCLLLVHLQATYNVWMDIWVWESWLARQGNSISNLQHVRCDFVLWKTWWFCYHNLFSLPILSKIYMIFTSHATHFVFKPLGAFSYRISGHFNPPLLNVDCLLQGSCSNSITIINPLVWASLHIKGMRHTDSCCLHWQSMQAGNLTQDRIKRPHKIQTPYVYYR